MRLPVQCSLRHTFFLPTHRPTTCLLTAGKAEGRTSHSTKTKQSDSWRHAAAAVCKSRLRQSARIRRGAVVESARLVAGVQVHSTLRPMRRASSFARKRPVQRAPPLSRYGPAPLRSCCFAGPAWHSPCVVLHPAQAQFSAALRALQPWPPSASPLHVLIVLLLPIET